MDFIPPLEISSEISTIDRVANFAGFAHPEENRVYRMNYGFQKFVNLCGSPLKISKALLLPQKVNT